MDTDQDIYNQPTEEEQQLYQAPQVSSGQRVPPTTKVPTAVIAPKRQWSRRKFMGASILGLVGLGGATAVGGFELERWLQNGGFHGPIASSVQTGHLLRRAGFGTNPQDLLTYANLGFSGAVDRLLNYSQVSDDALENSLKAL